MHIITHKSFLISVSGKDADLLIHEATLEDDLKAEAVAKKHRFKFILCHSQREKSVLRKI